MLQFFEFLYILSKQLIFLSVFTTIIIISGLTINIRSTALKKDVFRSVLIAYFKELICQNRQWVHRLKLNVLPFDSSVIRFNLEHHPIDINI